MLITDRILFALLILLALAGCTSVAQNRTSTEPCLFDASDAPVDCAPDRTSADKKAVTNSIEEHTEYALAFVEFDDQGWFYQPGQLKAVMDLLNREAEKQNLGIFVFVHGWKHTAKGDDRNVDEFRRILKRVSESAGASERVVGIYVGWRGLSATVEPFKEASFWDRKFTADHVAKGSAREIFARLRQFAGERNQRQPGRVRIVAMGHSFGALVLYNAVSQSLVEAALGPGSVQHYFDLIVLINPAFEASRYEPVHHIAQCRTYPADQQPILVSMTAANDWATGTFFKLGRKLSTFLEAYNSKIESREEEANHNTVGFVERYHTHSLYVGTVGAADHEEKSRVACAVPRADECVDLFDQDRRPASAAPTNEDEQYPKNMLLRHEPRSNCDPHNPFWIVKTDKNVIDGHDDFYKPERTFIDFVLELLRRQAQRPARR